MFGRCSTCDQTGEVFFLSDRKETNCTDCAADITMIRSLYKVMKTEELLGGDTTHIENELRSILEQLLERSRNHFFALAILGETEVAV